jgi:hypothetical protein
MVDSRSVIQGWAISNLLSRALEPRLLAESASP